MSKAKIIDKKSIESILGEKRILSELHHPFIVNMIYSFQDLDYLYLVMELLSGGNLRYHLSLKKRFNENQIKFIIGCIMIGLKYIHGENILHRDIKPENLVFDQNGYLRITDFGIAKHYVINNKKDTSGTVGYLAPEVLCNVNHNFSIDYYAVGIITYELMYGHRPYLGKNKHEVKQLILTRQAKIDYEDLPYGFTNDIADFINRLIQRKPKNRLGKDSINEVLNHPWIEDFDWDNCLNKKLKAPYMPKYGDNFDKNYCLKSNKIGTETMERYAKIMSKENIHLIFREFNCEKIPKELKGYTSNKKHDNFYVNNNNNNISSNMSTTSISRNNKMENKNNMMNYYNNMNMVNRNILKNKILSNDIEKAFNKNNNIGISNKTNYEINNQNKYIENIRHKMVERNNNNNLNISSKTYRNDSLTKKNKTNYISNFDNFDISGIMNHYNQKNIEENIVYTKRKKNLNRNISAKYINRNKSKIFFNNSTLDTKNKLNSGIIKNMRKQEINSYKSKKTKLRNHSAKETNEKRISNNYNEMQYNNNINKSINIPKTKNDFLGKELLRKNQSLLFPNNNTKSTSTLMSSFVYSKKKKSNKRLTSSNSMKNLYGNNFMMKEHINNSISMNKSKSILFDSINLNKSSKYINNLDKKLPFLSMTKKNEIDNNDIFYNVNKNKSNNNYEIMNDKDKNAINYDFLTERIKNKKIKK